MVAGCANIAVAAPDGGKANLDRGAATCATLCNVNRFCKSEHLAQTVHFWSLCNLCTNRRIFVAICAICNTRSKHYRDHTLVSPNNNVCCSTKWCSGGGCTSNLDLVQYNTIQSCVWCSTEWCSGGGCTSNLDWAGREKEMRWQPTPLPLCKVRTCTAMSFVLSRVCLANTNTNTHYKYNKSEVHWCLSSNNITGMQIKRGDNFFLRDICNEEQIV